MAATASTSAAVAPAPMDLWHAVLDDAARNSQRSTPSKTLLVLGDSKAGKSTLVSHLGSSSSKPVASTSAAVNLGLGFTYVDVRDDAEEETLARLGVYELGTAAPSHGGLLPLTLGADATASLADALALIVLDWSRPWHFLDALRRWLSVLERVTRSAAALEDGRERAEASWRAYVEPPAVARDHSDVDEPPPPLPPGVLTDNLGLPIIVVCTKSDAVATLERDKDLREDQVDYIQQVLRTICLRYGAALFFTSRLQPTSLSSLRSYVLHRLFTRPVSSVSSDPATKAAIPSSTSAFPFTQRANVVDRDQILVPAGWDSWGKIKVLRESFDPDALGEGWASDVSAGADGPSAIAEYRSQVVDPSSLDGPTRGAGALVEAQDEQDFLRAHFERLQRDVGKDARSHVARSAVAAQVAPPGSAQSVSPTFSPTPGVVGPMGSASLSLPGVANALDRDAEDPAARLARLSRKDVAPGARSGPLSPNGVSSPSAFSPPLASPAAGVASPGGQSQNEVLASFFQSLLSARSGSRQAGATASPTQPTAPRSTAPHARDDSR